MHVVLLGPLVHLQQMVHGARERKLEVRVGHHARRDERCPVAVAMALPSWQHLRHTGVRFPNGTTAHVNPCHPTSSHQSASHQDAAQRFGQRRRVHHRLEVVRSYRAVRVVARRQPLLDVPRHLVGSSRRMMVLTVRMDTEGQQWERNIYARLPPSRGGLPGLAGVTTRPAGFPSGGVPPAVERPLHLLTWSLYVRNLPALK